MSYAKKTLENKKEQFFIYFITVVLNLISFFLIFLMLETYASDQDYYMLLIVKIITTIILLLNIFYVYLKRTQIRLNKTNIYVKFFFFFWKMSPFLEMVLFINIDFSHYLKIDGPSWLIYFRIGNFLMKIFYTLYEDIVLKKSRMNRMLLIVITIVLMLNIYWRISLKFHLHDLILILFEMGLLLYTFDSYTRLFIKKKINQENVFLNFLDFEHEGTLILKENHNKKNINEQFEIIYYNEKFLNFFLIDKKNKNLKYSIIDVYVKNFQFQKIKHRENTFTVGRNIRNNEILNSLTEILLYYQQINEKNDLSLQFLFMRTSPDSNANIYLPRIKLSLKKAFVCDEYYYYMTFTKMENLLSLKEKYEFRNRLLNSFTHEVRTPLNGAIPILQELKMHSLENSDEQNNFCLDNALASLHLLENSLNNLTDYSLMGYDQFIINIGVIELELLLGEIFSIVRSQMNLKNLDFCINIDVHLLNRKIMSDYNRVKQLLLNILLNSIQFTYVGNIVLNITTKTENPLTIEFTIQDSGIGIESDKLENLKQKIKDSDRNEYQMNSSGSCLGLIMSQKLSLLLGKTDLEIISTIDKGTTVSFSVYDQNNISNNVSLDMTMNCNFDCVTCDNNDTNKNNNKKHDKISISTKNKKIIEFSKYLLSLRSKNLVLQKSLKDHINASSKDLNHEEKHDSVYVSGASDRVVINLDNILKDYDFDKIKDINKFSKSNNPNLRTNNALYGNGYKELIEAENLISRQKEAINKRTIFSLVNIPSLIKVDDMIVEFKEIHDSEIQRISCQNDKILLVDDDAFNLFSLEMILKGFNFRCEKAMNGKEALNKIMKLKCGNNNCKCGFKLIFMDFQMPIMNGVETTDKIMKMIERKEMNNVAVIGCTAFTTKDEIMQCLKAGMKDVIFKPINRNVISNILKAWT